MAFVLRNSNFFFKFFRKRLKQKLKKRHQTNSSGNFWLKKRISNNRGRFKEEKTLWRFKKLFQSRIEKIFRRFERKFFLEKFFKNLLYCCSIRSRNKMYPLAKNLSNLCLVFGNIFLEMTEKERAHFFIIFLFAKFCELRDDRKNFTNVCACVCGRRFNLSLFVFYVWINFSLQSV